MNSRDRWRQALVVLGAIVAIVGSFIGSGAAGGTPIQEAAGGALAADATLIAPAVPAFAIWTPIYLGLIGYAIWQCLPAQGSDPRQRRLGYPILASLLLNAAWILSIQFDLLWLSVPVIAFLLAVLARIFRLTLESRPRNLVEVVLVDGTMGLYLGWVCVATAANVTAVLVAAGFTGFGLSGDLWAVAVIAVAAGVGGLLAITGHGRLAPAASLAWGLAWLAWARLTGSPLSVPAGVAALAAVLLILVVTLVARRLSPKLPASPNRLVTA
jgi:hypothetical protein